MYVGAGCKSCPCGAVETAITKIADRKPATPVFGFAPEQVKPERAIVPPEDIDADAVGAVRQVDRSKNVVWVRHYRRALQLSETWRRV